MNQRFSNTALAMGGSVLVWAFALAGASCSSEPDGGSSPAGAATYYRDLKPLIDERCAGCHQDGGIAPFPLTTFEEVSAMLGPIRAAVESHTMPPWLADDACNDYASDVHSPTKR